MTSFPLSALCVRMPQLVMGASTCALLLRLSLVSMQGASGLATDTYKFVAVSLTLASVCTGLAQIMQVCILLFATAVLLALAMQQCKGIMLESVLHTRYSRPLNTQHVTTLHKLLAMT